ncbi:MAG TPA: transcriptional regulator [Tepidisphaeraceae bacterium]|jgi:DNA-binding transcriptional ArsR family regulator
MPSEPKNNAATPKVSGRYAYSGLERLLHEPSRLGILSSLAAHPEGLLFGDLKVLVNLTDGNLSRQIQALNDEGLIDVEKSFVKNRPQTKCRMTPDGRQRFVDYIGELERVVRDAAKVEQGGRLRVAGA